MLTRCLIFEYGSINLKCKPELAVRLREQYPSVQPGYHMNKKHWNSAVMMDGTISDKLLQPWIDHYYDLVAAGLPKNDRQALTLL
ncbi:MAG: MmcQ/YjbR family DNA-binding protein [Cytophagales bacterium]